MTLLFKLIWRDLRANPGRVAVSVFAHPRLRQPHRLDDGEL